MNELRNYVLCQALCDSLNARTIPGTCKYFLDEDMGRHYFCCADRSSAPVAWSFSETDYESLAGRILSYLEDQIANAK